MPSVVISIASAGVCAGKPITFTAAPINGGANPGYQWRVNGMAAGSTAVFVTGTLATQDKVQCFLAIDAVCPVAAQVALNILMVPVYPLPAFVIQAVAQSISQGDSVQLIITGTNNSSYKWTPAINISNTLVNNPKVCPIADQTYTVDVFSIAGCAASKQVTVSVITDVFVPSGFTPDGNGINDEWKIRGLELYPKCTVRVFDRWGGIVYSSTGYNKPWNGKPLNLLVSQTYVYAYVIDLKNGKVIKGTLTVI